ncbi:DEAD/DEAH box helicase, partial [Pedobacter alpinus]
FEDFGFNKQVLNAINDAGYTIPTPIQEKAIPPILNGQDVLGIAQTGTGKICCFTYQCILLVLQNSSFEIKFKFYS